MPEILKNIKAEDRLKKIRIVSENDDVMGGQPEADGMKENDNNAIFDLACSVMHALAEVAKVDQKAIPQILDALGDSRTAGASQRIVNEVNKLAKAAQTAANQANDKANTANTAAATADKKAVTAQNTANAANTKANQVPNPVVDSFVIGNTSTSYKLMTVDQVKTLLSVPILTSALSDNTTQAATPKMVNDVNRATKAAQTAANQANDKANTANTAAATADKKAVAAQNKADSAYNLANTANGAAANALKVANTKTTEAWVKSQGYITKATSNIGYVLVDFGTLGTNVRKVLGNPFGNNTPVITVTEALINGRWGDISFLKQGGEGRGTSGGFVLGEGLVVRTGRKSVSHHSDSDVGSVVPITIAQTAQVRMHVWRISQ